MLTTEQKIEEIYQMLRRQESHRRWGMFWRWFWRIVIIVCAASVAFFPGATMQLAYSVFAPMIRETIQETLQSQQQNVVGAVTGMRDSLMEKAQDVLGWR